MKSLSECIGQELQWVHPHLLKSEQATLFFPDGREYKWQRSSFWHDDWNWLNNEGTPLLHVKRGAHIQIEPAAQGLPELALLITLGWYLHKQQEKEAATIAASVPVVMR